MVVSDSLNKIAVAAQGTIECVRISHWEEHTNEKLDIPPECGKITKLLWSSDGQILIATTTMGHVIGYLTIIPSLYDAVGPYAGILTSLSEVSILDCPNNNTLVNRLNLDIEPTFLKLGKQHIAVASNNNIFYYTWSPDSNRGNWLSII